MSQPGPVEAIDQVGDDAFVRTAIRGLRAPDHHPDFWDHLAGRIGEVEAQVLAAAAAAPLPRTERAASDGPAHRVRSHEPRRAPLRAVAPAPAPAPVPIAMPSPVAGAAPAVPRPQVHVDAPVAGLPATPPDAAAPSASARLFQSAATAPVRPVADPLDGFTVKHDDATLPFSMRRASNAVLIAIAVAAVVVAAVAGLSLVRQRNEVGAPVGATSQTLPASAPVGSDGA